MPAIAIDAPIEGLDGLNGLDNMSPTAAVILDNWICRSGFLQSRPGYMRHTSDLGGAVETLVAYTPQGADTLIAGANNELRDVTEGGTGTLLYDSVDVVTNGAFAADTDWTKDAPWTIAAGVASSDGSQVAVSNLYQAAVTDGLTYYVSFTVSGYSAGNVRAVLGTTGTGTSRAANGTYSQFLTAGGSNPTRLNIEADADFIGNIDNVTAFAVAEGYANDRWQTAMFDNRLIFCNGSDPEMVFDGTDLTDLDYTGASPAVTPGQFLGVCVFKGRAYYWENASTKFTYAAAGGFQGALSQYDLGPVLHLGGKIVSMFPWTVDTGTGPDDMLVILSDVGEVVIYQGDDPGNAGYFEQVGRFRIPPPLSTRGNMKFGADVIIMTKNGYTNLATVLKKDEMSDYPAFSRKIARFVYDAGQAYASQYGHECLQTDLGVLLFNVPIGNSKAVQYVMNENTGAWSRLTNLNAGSWCRYGSDLYFGGLDGYVCKVTGYIDHQSAIPLNALPAYNYFGDPGNRKHVTAIQVMSTHPSPKLIDVTGYSDFEVPTVNNATSPGGADSLTLWNTAVWGDGWLRVGQSVPTTKGWQNVHAFGYAATVAVLMQIQSQDVIWRQTGLRFKMAGAQ